MAKTKQHDRTRQKSGLVRAVGWMSLGFGVLDWVSADRLARGVGLVDGKPVFRRAAARELGTGLAAIRDSASEAPIVARLIGDASDIAVLTATALRPGNSRRRSAWLGVGIVAAVTLLDAVALVDVARRRRAAVA